MKTHRITWHTFQPRHSISRRRPRWIRSVLAGLAISVLAGDPTALAYLCEGLGCVWWSESTFEGKTYGEWSAAYWQWLLALPKDQNPEMDQDDCRNGANGQSGPVWFLAQGGGATVVRHCIVPANKALFFPVVAGECSTLERPPYHGNDEAELRACISAILDQAVEVSCELDGTPIGNLTSHRAPSPLFDFTVPADNLIEVTAGNGQSVADGIYVLVWALNAGQHTIHTHAEVPALGFVQDMTYHLTIERPPWLALSSSTGVPLLQVGGEVGRQYVVEYTLSLPPADGWTSLLALTLTNSPQAVLDPGAGTVSQRFYRARLVP